MTIRGTRNATTMTMVESTRSESWEIGPGDDDVAGTVEYRKSDNDAPGTSAGMIFSSGGDHIPVGQAQADRLPA